MIAASYSRYSTDMQRRESIEDQERKSGKLIAEKLCLEISLRYRDHAETGWNPKRSDYQRMLNDAKRRAFQVLVLDDLSRLGRDPDERGQVIRRLEFLNIRVISCDGYDSALPKQQRVITRSARGMIDSMYSIDLAEKTHRGLAGQVLRGFNAGGRSYGYRSVPILSNTESDEYGRKKVLAVRREIIPEQASIILEIFELFVRGWSPRSIAHELNRRGVPSPRGGTWAQSAIYGDKSRSGVGLLNNPLYAGRMIWNRSTWERDPDTGKRRRKNRPQSEWVVHEDESLRIVPQELWGAAQQRMAASTLRGGSRGNARPKTLFGGLLRCGTCGGPVVAVDAYTYGCATRHDRGSVVCQGVRVSRSKTERLLVEDLRTDMLSPLRFSQLHTDVRELLRARRAAVDGVITETRRRLAQVEVEIANLVAAIKAGAYSQVLQSELARLEAERERLQAATSRPIDQDGPTPGEIPRLVERYRNMVEELRDALTRRSERSRAILADALGDVVLVKEPDGAVYAEFEDPAHRLLLAAGGGSYAIGSGGRIWNYLTVLLPASGRLK